LGQAHERRDPGEARVDEGIHGHRIRACPWASCLAALHGWREL